MSNVDLMMRYGRIPYQRGGDGVTGIDCVSLVKAYYRDRLGVILPESPWVWRKAFNLLDPTEPTQLHDVLFMMGANRVRLTDHMAIMVTPTDILHAASAYNGIVCVPYERNKHIVLGIARLK